MRILFVASSFPYPAIDGLKGTVLAALEHLARRHRITLVSSGGPAVLAEHTAAVRAMGIEVRLAPPPPPRGIGRKLWNLLFERVPDLVAAHRSTAMASLIRALASSGSFDLVHLDFGPMAQYLDEASPVPVVVNAHDSFSLNYGRRARAASLASFYFQIQADRFASFERRWLSRPAGVFVVSPDDLEHLRQLAPEAHLRMAPQGVDSRYFTPPGEPGDPATLVFHGNIGYHPNLDAIARLVDEILPIVWKSRADVRLVIAGQRPPPHVRALARDPRISVTGALADIRPAIGAGRINVNPLELGTGVKNKVLEAMAMERAVVASPAAVRGITTAIPGEELAVCDSPAAFAGAVLELLADPARAAEMGHRARLRVVADYPRERFVEELERLYADAVKAGSGQGADRPAVRTPR